MDKSDLPLNNLPNSDSDRDKAFFSKKKLNQLSTNTPKRVKRNNLILNSIRQNPGITPYKLSKELGINYTDVTRVVKDLEYCGLIFIKKVIENNHMQKKLFCWRSKNE